MSNDFQRYIKPFLPLVCFGVIVTILDAADSGFKFFSGYKYGPAMARFYEPFVRWRSHVRGLYAANGLLFLGTAALIGLLVYHISASFFSVATAVCAFLLPPFNYFELFS
jgi:hypothetical protein